jgi:SulP family sulfate permease
MAAMAGVLMLVSYNLIDLHHIKKILTSSRQEALVLAATFFSTLFVQLEFAIFSGVMLSLLMYLLRTSRPNLTTLCSQYDPCGNTQILYSCALTSPQCPQIRIIRIDGSIFFGAANYISKQLNTLTRQYCEQCHILIICSSINFIDVSGCEMLAREGHNLYLEGRRLYLCELKDEVLEVINRGQYGEIGKLDIYESVEDAVAGIVPTLDPERCRLCGFRLFDSCPPKDIMPCCCELSTSRL